MKTLISILTTLVSSAWLENVKMVRLLTQLARELLNSIFTACLALLENSWSKIIEIMVDILPADDPDSTLFIGNILDCIALPSSEIVSRLNEKLIILAKSTFSCMIN